MRRALTPDAENDIFGILEWSYERFGEKAQERYRILISTALRDITENPERAGSRARPDLAKNLRTYHLRFSQKRARARGGSVQNPRHFLLYRRLPGSIVEVGRILYDSMDIEINLPENYRDAD